MEKEYHKASKILTEQQSGVLRRFADDLKRLANIEVRKATNELQLRKRK